MSTAADDQDLPEPVRDEIHRGVRRWILRTKNEHHPARANATRWSANAVLGALAVSTLAPVCVAVAAGGSALRRLPPSPEWAPTFSAT